MHVDNREDSLQEVILRLHNPKRRLQMKIRETTTIFSKKKKVIFFLKKNIKYLNI